jgi:MFS family permease
MYSGDWLLRLSQFVRDPARPAPWRIPANVWALGVTSLLTDISSEMVVSVLPAYLVMTGGLTPVVLGVATGLHEGGPLLAAWIGGLVADRTGRRKLTAAAGYAVSALCRLGWFALSTRSLAPVAALVASDRVGKAIRTAPRDAMISLSVPPAQLATAFGVHRALDAAGAALGPVVAFAVLWQLPRRYDVIFLISLVAGVLGVVALLVLVDEQPDRRHTPGDAPRAPWPGALAAFANASLRPLMILAAACALVTVSDAFIYLMLVQRAQAGPQWIPLLYTGTAVSFLLLAIPVGYAADRIGRRSVFLLGHVLLVLAYGAAFGGVGPWPWNALACVALLGGYYAASDGVLAGLASALLSPQARAMGLAWVATAVSVARMCSAIAFGLLWTRAGDAIAVATFAIALIIVLGLAVMTRPGEGSAP